jgi:hypothetical protein
MRVFKNEDTGQRMKTVTLQAFIVKTLTIFNRFNLTLTS